ncbi:Tumor protein D52 [Bagarius yarrelli]|uniref:Tumor protein D52 n=1 Tax=Bagarius yarrelli TaxID=175774 RepID=A0A556TPR3_BAGYA|nr:Tumor protein D52 [Bagarius yarrelli]
MQITSPRCDLPNRQVDPHLSWKPSAQRPDSIPEVGEDAASTLQPASSTGLTEEEQEELHSELVKVEEEIQTLTQVLASKERHLAEIKRKLGITPFNELKQNLSKSWQEVTTSTANTPTFKSFEDKVESLKTKVSPTTSSEEMGIESESSPSAEPVVKQPEGTTILASEPR